MMQAGDLPTDILGDDFGVDDIVWAIPESDPLDAMDEFDWQSFASSSPSTTVDSPQWSLDDSSGDDTTVTTEYGSNKRPKSDTGALKLQKNKEAAARSRLKRKQEQNGMQKRVADLENQIGVVKEENEALKLENMTLRSENSTLREKLTKFTMENKATVSGVAVFGFVCLFPLFSSVDSQSDLFSTIMSCINYFVPADGGMNGRVLLSDDALSGSSLGLLGWYAFLGAVVVGMYMYSAQRSLSLKASTVLPRTRTQCQQPTANVTKTEAALKIESQAKKRGLGFRVGGLRVWLANYGMDTGSNLPK